MNFNWIKTALLAATAMVSLNSFSQDLIARQAPIDRKLKSVDSLALQKQIRAEQSLYPGLDLYPNWNNEFVQAYGNAIVPESYTFDLTGFCMPTPNTRITDVFGYRPRRRRAHYGLDIKVYVGDTIRAAFDGKVRVVKNQGRRGYGKYVVIRHDNGLETVYGHLSKQLVDTNQLVKAGEPIALGGNTGRSTGSHLHFETRFLGQALNPADIIDFESCAPHQDQYVFHNVKINGRKSNIYTSSNEQMVYHRVKSGDTLGKIARMYGTTVNELCRLNGLKGTSMLRIGQSIRCSAGVETAAKATPKAQTQKKSTASVSSKKITVQASSSATASLGEDTNTMNDVEATSVYHRIKSGDTLGAIAKRYGTSVSKLCELNGITKTTVLRLGRSLRCS